MSNSKYTVTHNSHGCEIWVLSDCFQQVVTCMCFLRLRKGRLNSPDFLFLNRYWPNIDDALRRAAFDRKVQVRLMASLWNHTRFDMKFYLRSLAALNGANFASVQVVCILLGIILAILN